MTTRQKNLGAVTALEAIEVAQRRAVESFEALKVAEATLEDFGDDGRAKQVTKVAELVGLVGTRIAGLRKAIGGGP